MVPAVEQARNAGGLPARIHGLIGGRFDLSNTLGQFLVCLPAGKGVALPGWHLVQIHDGVLGVPLIVIFGAAVGLVVQNVKVMLPVMVRDRIWLLV